MTNRRYLGIDYGTKRIGLAVSNTNGKMAFPRETIPNDKNTLTLIRDLVSGEGITDIVMGESLDYSGKPNPLSTKIDVFTKLLTKELGLSMHTQKEFLTTVEARRALSGPPTTQTQSHNRVKKTQTASVDQIAATLILQRYLDKSNK